MQFIMGNYKNKVKFNQQKETLKLVIMNDFKSPEDLLEYLIKFCRDVIEEFKKQMK